MLIRTISDFPKSLLALFLLIVVVGCGRETRTQQCVTVASDEVECMDEEDSMDGGDEEDSMDGGDEEDSMGGDVQESNTDGDNVCPDFPKTVMMSPADCKFDTGCTDEDFSSSTRQAALCFPQVNLGSAPSCPRLDGLEVSPNGHKRGANPCPVREGYNFKFSRDATLDEDSFKVIGSAETTSHGTLVRGNGRPGVDIGASEDKVVDLPEATEITITVGFRTIRFRFDPCTVDDDCEPGPMGKKLTVIQPR